MSNKYDILGLKEDTFHPLELIFEQAVKQASEGKGSERHGSKNDFLKQQWVTLAETHGVGFLTGQAQKKLTEAVTNKTADNFDWYERELLGAINYIAMAILKEKHGIH
jgi:hypothetical protein